MSSPSELLKAWATNIRGSVAIWSALSLPLVLGSAVLGIDYGYLKIAHGRDVGDCPSNRGRISPFTWETLHVSVRVEAL